MPYLGKTPSQATRQRYYKTASGGETSISGTMTTGGTLTFNDGEFVDVSVNGVALVAGTDYNTTTANTIGGLSALSANDQVEIVVYDTFSVFGGNVDGDFTVSNGTLTAGTVDINGGAVDGTTIGAASASTGAFTTISADGLDLGTTTDAATVSNTASDYQLQLGAAQSTTGDIGRNISFALSGTTTAAINTVDAGTSNAQSLAFFTGNGTSISEAARFDSSQNLLVGKTATGLSTTGFQAIATGNQSAFISDGDRALILNRQTSDGSIQEFRKDGTTVGSISSSSGKIAVTLDPRSAATTGSGFLGGDGAIFPSDKTGVASDADVSLGGASTRFKDLYLSGGAYLGGTGSDNHLDDYEEGDWTPDIRESGTAISDAAYNTSFTGGQYTKVGRVVHLTCSIRLTSKGSPTASSGFQIGGLPFTSTNNIKARTAVAFYNHTGAGIDTTGNTNGTLMGLLQHNADEISWRVEDFSGTVGEGLEYADIADTLYLQLSFSYITG